MASSEDLCSSGLCLGLPKVSKRWGKDGEERKEIPICTLSVQDTVQVQNGKGWLKGKLFGNMGSP